MKMQKRMWMYSKGMPKGKIFEEGDEITSDWVDSPTKIDKPAVKVVKSTVKKKKAIKKAK